MPASPAVHGTVHLVGAGPGDPGLLTVRARDLLAACDCVVHDYLVSPGILSLIPADAARHYVGKRGHSTSITQDEINALLVNLASKHRRIVRLKGGDPFLFGRGGEEAAALAAAGVPFSVVPGITSGIGAPAYAGIPVTHRASGSVVAFAAGHQQAHAEGLDYAALSGIETVVFYMGMHRLEDNCQGLIRHGRSADTPACSIQWGTHGRQRVVEGTLATLPERCRAAGLGAPAITVVGDVVRYREHIRWFDNRSLSGRRVVVTRAREQASDLANQLREAGAEVIELPMARYVAAPSPARDAALARLADHTWIAFTSANAVRFTWEHLRATGRDARAFGACRIAAVGPATAAALDAIGLNADLVPDQHDADGLAAALTRISTAHPKPLSVLLPQADNARPTLREQLEKAGITVTSTTVYRAEPLPIAPDVLADGADAVTFASAATVERFVTGLGAERIRALTTQGCRFYAIGPFTAAAISAAGLQVAATAPDASVEALVATLGSDLGPIAD
jgi:uroporphyrinogen III methyltransferase/synthase